jgi:hypothetical protein
MACLWFLRPVRVAPAAPALGTRALWPACDSCDLPLVRVAPAAPATGPRGSSRPRFCDRSAWLQPRLAINSLPKLLLSTALVLHGRSIKDRHDVLIRLFNDRIDFGFKSRQK